MPKVSFKTIDSVEVSGKRVLVRVDLNVPMKNGQVTDATRIERAAPTLAELAAKGRQGDRAQPTSAGPDGKRVPEMSLKPLVEPLSKALGKPVAFAEDCIGPLAERRRARAAEAGRGAAAGKSALPQGRGKERRRLHRQAVGAGRRLCERRLLRGASCAPLRPKASPIACPAAAGRPDAGPSSRRSRRRWAIPSDRYAPVVGGAKVSSKLDLLGNLVGRVDKLIIGGGMANTFLHAPGDQGRQVAVREGPGAKPRSTSWPRQRPPSARSCYRSTPSSRGEFKANRAASGGRRHGLSRRPDDPRCRPQVDRASISRSWPIAKPLVWNGPLGTFEMKPFDAGTVALAEAVARADERRASFCRWRAGGDTVAALAAAGVEDKFSYVSTAGGAFLEWMEGKTLPGVAALVRAA